MQPFRDWGTAVLNHMVYIAQMNLTAALTQSDMAPGTIDAYLPKFERWTDGEFAAAMEKCGDELNRFPTVAQIRARRPSSHRKAAEVIQHGGLLAITEDPDARGPDDLENYIDKLKADEVAALVRWYSPYDDDPSMNEDAIVRACEFVAEKFLANPQSAVYRGYVRDAALKMKQRREATR